MLRDEMGTGRGQVGRSALCLRQVVAGLRSAAKEPVSGERRGHDSPMEAGEAPSHGDVRSALCQASFQREHERHQATPGPLAPVLPFSLHPSSGLALWNVWHLPSGPTLQVSPGGGGPCWPPVKGANPSPRYPFLLFCSFSVPTIWCLYFSLCL